MVTATFVIALAAVGLMAFANQRSGTCMVAAIDEIVTKRRIGRLAAVVEACLWVGGGFILLNAIGMLPSIPVGYVAGSLTVFGGALFGVGAFVNRSCVFGTVARIGSGDWAYCVTPLGFYLGSLVAVKLPVPQQITWGSVVLTESTWLPLLVVILAIAGLFAHGVRVRQGKQSAWEHLWSPHVATTIIGITYLVAFVAVGTWTYSKLLSDLAKGSGVASPSILLLYVALLTGAVAGGWSAGRIKLIAPSAGSLIRCLLGGVMMGVGAALIPGGNTGLTLVGMPLLWPNAWLAFLCICLAIYVCVRIANMAGSAGASGAPPKTR